MISEDFVASVIEAYPKEFALNNVAFDIGAHHGKFTEILSDKFDKVYAFEPFPENIKILKEKFANNPKVVIVEKAVHRKNSIERLYLNGEDTQSSISKLYPQICAWNFRPQNFIDVETITLDTFCEMEKIDNLQFIKIDVEGAEQYVFDGAQKTLEKFNKSRGWIVLECHLMVDWDHINETLKKYDYKFIDTNLYNVDFLEPCNHYLIHRSNYIFKSKIEVE